MTGKDLTGIRERWTSEKKEWKSREELLNFLKQKKAYDAVIEKCRGKNVLDYGCGSGYGTALLAGSARKVTGVDVNGEVIDFCRETYKKSNLAFAKIEPYSICGPAGEKFDVIVSFQVIEHIPDVKKYLGLLKCLLNEDGVLVVSTPNRKNRLLPLQRPWNREHIREYSRKSLMRELKAVFKDVEIRGICGTDTVNSVLCLTFTHKASAFVRQILKSLLPASVVSMLKKPLERDSKKEPVLGPLLAAEYSLGDFSITGDTDVCLDFFAVCRI